MKKATIVSIVAMAAFVMTALPTKAITYGTEDNGGHPNVGALIRQRTSGPNAGTYGVLCSGTLIDDQLFLTAAHCTEALDAQGVTQAWVSFDSEITMDMPPNTVDFGAVTKYVASDWETYPGFTPTLKGDVGLVFLDSPVSIAPAAIIGESGLSLMKQDGTLHHATFTNVGYGTTSEWQHGAPVLDFDGVRRYSMSPQRGLTKNNLILLMNHSATGNGGTCSGDSGGPHFVGESDVIASVTSWGDPLCRSLDQTQRIDIPAIHEWIMSNMD